MIFRRFKCPIGLGSVGGNQGRTLMAQIPVMVSYLPLCMIYLEGYGSSGSY